MKCLMCEEKEATIFVAPCRSFTSPSRSTAKLGYCSKECEELDQKITYTALAILDRNASDSKCFVHLGWNGNRRVGRCKITGKEFEVIPLSPGDNSLQPKECYDHFELHERYEKYRKYLNKNWK